MNHYEVLGVAPSAPVAEVRSAYIEQARRHHPDRGGDPGAMRVVNEAWAALSDPGRRAQYDRVIGATAPVPAAEPVRHHILSEEEDLLADLADDGPIGGTVRLPRWMALLPVAVFVSSLVVGMFGMLFMASTLITVAVFAFLLSCGLFLISPFVALYASRRTTR
ncbi:MAG: J domain-containing protein [Acidimicrobiia bacterium]|nr:J domain-containing protein [Acidimicrobiia bacterium]